MSEFIDINDTALTFIEFCELLVQRNKLIQLKSRDESIDDRRIFLKNDNRNNPIIYSPYSKNIYNISFVVYGKTFDFKNGISPVTMESVLKTFETPENLEASAEVIGRLEPFWNSQREDELSNTLSLIERFYLQHENISIPADDKKLWELFIIENL